MIVKVDGYKESFWPPDSILMMEDFMFLWHEKHSIYFSLPKLVLFPKTNIVYFNNSFTAKVAKDAEIS